MNREEIISCIGMNYIEPILLLYKELISHNYSGNSKIKVSSKENGYSISIITLSVLTVESALNRIKYLKKCKKRNLKFFENEFNNQSLYDKLVEIYVLRDLIVHNHIWCSYLNRDENDNETKIYQKLLEGYGDKKYQSSVNKRTKKTKTLKLNINPMKIGIKDVKIVLTVLKDLFEFFDNEDLSYFSMRNHHFKFDDEYRKFSEIVNEINGRKT